MLKKEAIIKFVSEVDNVTDISKVNDNVSYIINGIKEKFSIEVSKRHVKRVLKYYKKYVKGKNGMKSKEKKDIFTTNSIPENLKEEKIVNTINDGIVTIQELCEIFNMDENEVYNVIKRNSGSIEWSNILDETIDSVYSHFKNENENVFDVSDEKDEKGGDTEIVWDSKYPSRYPDYGIGYTARYNSFYDNKREPLFKKKEEEYFEVEIDCVNACGKTKKSVDVYLDKKAKVKALKFMNWAGAREWLAYLIGEKIVDEKDKEYYVVYDLHLPEQKTSSTLVHKVIEENYNKLKIIGVIHSHHEMGAGDADRPSFSGHDANFINSNHNISLLAGRDRQSKGFKIVGIARTETPCGSRIQIKANVKYLPVDETEEEKKLKAEFEKKVLGPTNVNTVTKLKNDVRVIRNKETAVRNINMGFNNIYEN